MPTRSRLLPGLVLAFGVAACGDVQPADPLDGGVDGDAGIDAPDVPPTDAPPAPTCDVSNIGVYTPVPPANLVVRQILPSDTARGGELIQDTLQGTTKRHYVSVASDGRPLRGELFLWLAGSGGEPEHYTSILNIAADAGYVSLSLAYDNETSITDRCSVAGDPVCSALNPECERDVRAEMLYGREVIDSPCIDVAGADAIEHRTLRMLQYAAQNLPGANAGAFLQNGGTEVNWSKVAVGGWSQGGGHAGMLARDHRVARALFVSKGADSALCPTTVDDPAECDLDGDGQLTSGNVDELMVPAPWAHDARFTFGNREFGLVHTDETAWSYSREVFELFGMGAKANAVVLDDLAGGLGAPADAYGCAHVLATRTAPAPTCGATDFHASMATNGCLARDGAGLPLLAPAYHYALTVPVD